MVEDDWPRGRPATELAECVPPKKNAFSRLVNLCSWNALQMHLQLAITLTDSWVDTIKRFIQLPGGPAIRGIPDGADAYSSGMHIALLWHYDDVLYPYIATLQLVTFTRISRPPGRGRCEVKLKMEKGRSEMTNILLLCGALTDRQRKSGTPCGKGAQCPAVKNQRLLSYGGATARRPADTMWYRRPWRGVWATHRHYHDFSCELWHQLGTRVSLELWHVAPLL